MGHMGPVTTSRGCTQGGRGFIRGVGVLAKSNPDLNSHVTPSLGALNTNHPPPYLLPQCGHKGEVHTCRRGLLTNLISDLSVQGPQLPTTRRDPRSGVRKPSVTQGSIQLTAEVRIGTPTQYETLHSAITQRSKLRGQIPTWEPAKPKSNQQHTRVTVGVWAISPHTFGNHGEGYTFRCRESDGRGRNVSTSTAGGSGPPSVGSTNGSPTCESDL